MNAREILARLAESGTPPDGPSALRLAVGLEDSLSRLETETLPYLRAGGAEYVLFMLLMAGARPISSYPL